MRYKYIIIPIIAILCVSCSRSPSHQLNLSAGLRDGGKMVIDLEIKLENEEALKEIIEKSDQIKRAFKLVLKDYRGDQFAEGEKATASKILRRIFRSQLECKIVEIKYNSYEIQKYHPKIKDQ